MTVREYLCFVYELKGCTLNRKKHIEDVMNVTKISDVADRVIRNLSKGYKQRVGIAQAIVGDPKTIILDEPTIGLDPKQIIGIRNLIRILGRDHAVILSTHILSEVQAVCDRIIIVNKGQIVADKPTDELSQAVDGSRRIQAMICGPAKSVYSAIRALEGVVRVDQIAGHDLDSTTYVIESAPGVDIRRDLFKMLAENDWPIIGLENKTMDLEHVFIALTGEKAAKKKVMRK